MPRKPKDSETPSSAANHLAGDLSPEDMTDELEAVDVPAEELGEEVPEGGPGHSGAAVGDAMLVHDDVRNKLRSIWTGVGASCEVLFGPELRLDDRDLDLLVQAWEPVAIDLGGLEFLGRWVIYLTAASCTGAVYMPRLREAAARRETEVRSDAESEPSTPTGTGSPEPGPEPTRS